MQKITGWLVTTILALLMLVVHSPIASAQASTGSTTQGSTSASDGTGGGVTVNAGSTTTTPGSPGSTTVWTPPSEQCGVDSGVAAPGVSSTGAPGAWVLVVCVGLNGQDTSYQEFVPFNPQPQKTQQPAVQPVQVAQSAEASMSLPDPAIGLSPSSFGVVNLPTWLWISPSIWHSYSTSASAGGVGATATATPTSVTWTMGDGNTVTCNGPGTPYDSQLPASAQSTTCFHVYRTPSGSGGSSGGYSIEATIHWSVSWTSNGVSGGGQLPSLKTTATVPYQVQQIESIIGG
ncbi:MAG: hypothetical protein ACYDGY_01850 [Acidimicrobiales bacterium]